MKKLQVSKKALTQKNTQLLEAKKKSTNIKD